MTTRRSLTEGMKPVNTVVEQAFVQGKNMQPSNAPPPTPPRIHVERLLVSARIRADLATGFKRASLERKLRGDYPHELQEMLEEAVEAWLIKHSHLP